MTPVAGDAVVHRVGARLLDAEFAPNSTSIVLRGEIRAGSDDGRRGESTSRTLTPRVLNASLAERGSSRLSSTGCRHHTRFEGEFQRTAQRWGRIIEAWTKGTRGPAPDRLRPVLLKQEDPLGEVKVLAALLAAQTGHSHEQAVYALLEEEGEIRRQMFEAQFPEKASCVQLDRLRPGPAWRC